MLAVSVYQNFRQNPSYGIMVRVSRLTWGNNPQWGIHDMLILEEMRNYMAKYVKKMNYKPFSRQGVFENVNPHTYTTFHGGNFGTGFGRIFGIILEFLCSIKIQSPIIRARVDIFTKFKRSCNWMTNIVTANVLNIPSTTNMSKILEFLEFLTHFSQNRKSL